MKVGQNIHHALSVLNLLFICQDLFLIAYQIHYDKLSIEEAIV